MEQTKPIGTAATPAEKLVDTIIKGIQEKKGQDITVVDLRGIDGAIASFFVICQGNTPTQVEAITDSVAETARINAGEKPAHVVGLELAHWVAMDFTDVIVHIFVPDMRSYYNIENLWQDAQQTEIPNLD
jgi:ribosome-associated protein